MCVSLFFYENCFRYSEMINIFLRNGKQTHIISANSNIYTKYIFAFMPFCWGFLFLSCAQLVGGWEREEYFFFYITFNKNSSLFDFDIIFAEIVLMYIAKSPTNEIHHKKREKKEFLLFFYPRFSEYLSSVIMFI